MQCRVQTGLRWQVRIYVCIYIYIYVSFGPGGHFRYVCDMLCERRVYVRSAGVKCSCQKDRRFMEQRFAQQWQSERMEEMRERARERRRLESHERRSVAKKI